MDIRTRAKLAVIDRTIAHYYIIGLTRDKWFRDMLKMRKLVIAGKHAQATRILHSGFVFWADQPEYRAAIGR